MHDHNLDDLIIDNIEPKKSKLKSFLTIIALLIVILIIAIVLTRILLKSPQNNDLVFEQETEELIAPELKLKETPKQEEQVKEPELSNIVQDKTESSIIEEKKAETIKEPSVITKKEEPKATETKKEPELSNITAQEVKAPVATEKEAVSQTLSQEEKEAKDAADIAYWESVQAKRKAEQEALEKSEQKAKESLKEVNPSEAEKTAPPAAKVKQPEQKVVEEKTVQKPIPTKQGSQDYSGKKYYIQVGAYRKEPSARFMSVIRNNGYNYIITKPNKNGIKRILIGPYENEAAVNRALAEVKDRVIKRAFVVKR